MNKSIINIEILKQFCQKYYIRKLSVFYSYLTDKYDESKSDIDLLAEFDKEHVPDLFSFSGMELELS
ncbi:MAG: nucleotidyltransferase domain-containing protein [Bacteroidetes bacterium]|nr:nucleotidyltransferase domain-containing protein [Bacteroidota bacterium]